MNRRDFMLGIAAGTAAIAATMAPERTATTGTVDGLRWARAALVHESTGARIIPIRSFEYGRRHDGQSFTKFTLESPAEPMSFVRMVGTNPFVA